jgi:hypothetical protein
MNNAESPTTTSTPARALKTPIVSRAAEHENAPPQRGTFTAGGRCHSRSLDVPDPAPRSSSHRLRPAWRGAPDGSSAPHDARARAGAQCGDGHPARGLGARRVRCATAASAAHRHRGQRGRICTDPASGSSERAQLRFGSSASTLSEMRHLSAGSRRKHDAGPYAHAVLRP